MDEGSGIEPDGQLFSPSPILSNIDQDVVDEGFSPAFINVDHELETPNGIEGPIPVYVEAPVSTTTKESILAQTPLNFKPSLNFHNSTKVRVMSH